MENIYKIKAVLKTNVRVFKAWFYGVYMCLYVLVHVYIIVYKKMCKKYIFLLDYQTPVIYDISMRGGVKRWHQSKKKNTD